MVMVGTRLYVGDNSGCRKVKCIKVLGNGKKKGTVGDCLIISVVKALPNKKIKKHDVRKVLLVRSNTNILRRNGLKISFLQNVVLMIDIRGNPLGNRIIGSVTQELRKKKKMKILSMATSVN